MGLGGIKDPEMISAIRCKCTIERTLNYKSTLQVKVSLNRRFESYCVHKSLVVTRVHKMALCKSRRVITVAGANTNADYPRLQ